MVHRLTRLLGPRQATRWISSHGARAKIYRPGQRTSHLGRGFFFQLIRTPVLLSPPRSA